MQKLVYLFALIALGAAEGQKRTERTERRSERAGERTAERSGRESERRKETERPGRERDARELESRREADRGRVESAPTGGKDSLLNRHKEAGGHMTDLHVGKSEAQLRERIQKDGLQNGASSFRDHATAEKATRSTLDANSGRIQSWLKSSSPREVVEHRSNEPVGVKVEKSGEARSAYGTRLVLDKNPRMPEGYVIRTGYPI